MLAGKSCVSLGHLASYGGGNGGEDEEGIREKRGCRYSTVYLRIKKKYKEKSELSMAKC